MLINIAIFVNCASISVNSIGGWSNYLFLVDILLAFYVTEFWFILNNSRGIFFSMRTHPKWEKCLKVLLFMLLSRYPERDRFPRSLLNAFSWFLLEISLRFFS